MADFQFPRLNPKGPLPAPNSHARGDRPAVRAGRELSAYGDRDYPEACGARERRETAQALSGDAQLSNDAMGGFDPSA